MIVDAHQHFWKFDPIRDAWITNEMQVLRRDFSADDLAVLLRKNAIDGCVAVQADQSENETHFLLDIAQKSPIVKGVVGWVDLRAGNLEDRLKYFSQFPLLKGFRHIVQGQPAGFMDDPTFRRGVSLLSNHKFTYDLLIYHYQLPEAIRFVSSITEVPVVLDHIAKPSIATGELDVWAKDIRALAALPNVYCKLSGMITEANWKKWKPADFTPYLDVVMEAFTPSRLMYGSDWPVCLLSGSYEEQLSIVKTYVSSLSASEREAIMGGNAIKFYNI